MSFKIYLTATVGRSHPPFRNCKRKAKYKVYSPEMAKNHYVFWIYVKIFCIDYKERIIGSKFEITLISKSEKLNE